MLRIRKMENPMSYENLSENGKSATSCCESELPSCLLPLELGDDKKIPVSESPCIVEISVETLKSYPCKTTKMCSAHNKDQSDSSDDDRMTYLTMERHSIFSKETPSTPCTCSHVTSYKSATDRSLLDETWLETSVLLSGKSTYSDLDKSYSGSFSETSLPMRFDLNDEVDDDGDGVSPFMLRVNIKELLSGKHTNDFDDENDDDNDDENNVPDEYVSMDDTSYGTCSQHLRRNQALSVNGVWQEKISLQSIDGAQSLPDRLSLLRQESFSDSTIPLQLEFRANDVCDSCPYMLNVNVKELLSSCDVDDEDDEDDGENENDLNHNGDDSKHKEYFFDATSSLGEDLQSVSTIKDKRSLLLQKQPGRRSIHSAKNENAIGSPVLYKKEPSEFTIPPQLFDEALCDSINTLFDACMISVNIKDLLRGEYFDNEREVDLLQVEPVNNHGPENSIEME